MRITTHVNPYSPESYLTVKITIARNEAVSFSEVASVVQQAVAEASDTAREKESTPPSLRQVVPKGYFDDENAPR